jgi:CheY-like chemotaxis protein
LVESRNIDFDLSDQALQNQNNKKHECCRKVLVVDDNPFNVKSTEMILKHCFNLECDTAHSGEEGIRLVNERMNRIHKYGCSELYPLILTDINMPEMDGLQMTRHIRELIINEATIVMQGQISFQHLGASALKRSQPKCVIWAVTAMNEHEIESEVGMRMGLDGVSVKPLSFETLLKILKFAHIEYLTTISDI